MKLNGISDNQGSSPSRKRVGRGIGSGMGKTGGRGVKAPEYREQFAGGFVFEYSTEKIFAQESSPWPFREFGPQNSGKRN